MKNHWINVLILCRKGQLRFHIADGEVRYLIFDIRTAAANRIILHLEIVPK